MARILMTWELGGGYGHLAPLLALARPLKDAGHEIAFAVRDVAAAEAVLGESGIPYYPAPANFFPLGPVSLHSYAQILLQTAFNGVQELRGRVRAWQALYDLLRPDILVCDHSPTALLAARGRDLHCIFTGTGFSVPPDVKSLPELRPWAPLDPGTLQRDEARALDMASAVARDLGLPALAYLAEIYSHATPALFTLKELDCYAEQRPDASYWGPLPGPGGAAPQWPEGEGKRVFLYGQPFESLPQVLESLHRGKHRVLAYIPKLAPDLRQKFQGGRLRFADKLQDMAAVTREADCAVMTNGHTTTAAMLLAGKPVLLLPQHLEMLLIARRVETGGLGLSAPLLKLEGILGKLDRILNEESFTKTAKDFAARYRDVGSESPRRHFQALVTRLAGSR
jgi:UDP:flavonoid glycosyltransferase YjiC (YdhE family)